jgi:hypothetical protein
VGDALTVVSVGVVVVSLVLVGLVAINLILVVALVSIVREDRVRRRGSSSGASRGRQSGSV